MLKQEAIAMKLQQQKQKKKVISPICLNVYLLLNCRNKLTLFFPMFAFDPPENKRKPLVF